MFLWPKIVVKELVSTYLYPPTLGCYLAGRGASAGGVRLQMDHCQEHPQQFLTEYTGYVPAEACRGYDVVFRDAHYRKVDGELLESLAAVL